MFTYYKKQGFYRPIIFFDATIWMMDYYVSTFGSLIKICPNPTFAICKERGLLIK
jgi:hypothetical protein